MPQVITGQCWDPKEELERYNAERSLHQRCHSGSSGASTASSPKADKVDKADQSGPFSAHNKLVIGNKGAKITALSGMTNYSQ